jgi:hypothetical protein
MHWYARNGAGAPCLRPSRWMLALAWESSSTRGLCNHVAENFSGLATRDFLLNRRIRPGDNGQLSPVSPS